ncbi:MAG TPA: S8/S53 family peptidase, partial [bacterium]|nr:S8/S53 family peptidase [bacterium]
HEQQKTAPYSARGGSVSGVDLLAAGSDYTFWTNKPCHLSQDIDGTSFSAPYTTRVIRMMRQINPQLKGETVIAILKASAEDLGTQLPEDQGAGRLVASRCFFLAWLMRPGIRGPKKADVLAKELCIEHELRELRWLARRIKSRQRHNVSVDQSYGVYEKI